MEYYNLKTTEFHLKRAGIMGAGKPEKYFDVALAIRNLAETSNLKSGDRLPSETQLAAQYHCSHLTVRKALALLEKEQLIYKIPCRGTFMGEKHSTNVLLKNVIAFILPHNEMYYYQLFYEFSNRLWTHNLIPLLCVSVGDAAHDQKIFELAAKKMLAGIITVPNRKYRSLYRELHVPLLFFDDFIEDLEVPYVISDDAQGAVHVARYLHDLGHTRIAFVGDLADQAVRRRFDGLKSYCDQYKLLIPEKYIKWISSHQEWSYFAAQELFLLNAPPTAVICGNDTHAAGVMRYCREHRIAVPRDCSIMGFSDSALAEDLGISSVNQHSDRIAEALTKHMITLLNGQTPPQKTTIITDLLIRHTTAIAPRPVRTSRR